MPTFCLSFCRTMRIMHAWCLIYFCSCFFHYHCTSAFTTYYYLVLLNFNCRFIFFNLTNNDVCFVCMYVDNLQHRNSRSKKTRRIEASYSLLIPPLSRTAHESVATTEEEHETTENYYLQKKEQCLSIKLVQKWLYLSMFVC